MWMELVAAGEFGQILIGVECLCPLVLIETRDTQPCVSVLACLPAAGFLCCFLWAPAAFGLAGAPRFQAGPPYLLPVKKIKTFLDQTQTSGPCWDLCQ